MLNIISQVRRENGSRQSLINLIYKREDNSCYKTATQKRKRLLGEKYNGCNFLIYDTKILTPMLSYIMYYNTAYKTLTCMHINIYLN